MSTVYSQNWADGNSDFTTIKPFDRAIEGADPLYPEVKYSDLLTISGGRLTWDGTGPFFWSGTSLVLQGFASFDGTVGSITATHRPDSVALANNTYAILLHLESTGGGGEILELAVDGTGPWTLRTHILGTYDGEIDVSDSFAPVADTDYTIKVCWKTGTVVGDFDDVLADGYVRVYVNGVLVRDLSDISFYINYANTNHVDEVWFGNYGMFGALSNIIFSDSACGGIVGSTVFGVTTTVTATRAFAVGLDNNVNTLSEEGKFKIFGDLEVTGTVTFADLTVTDLTNIMGAMVTTGSELVLDSSGNIVFVNG